MREIAALLCGSLSLLFYRSQKNSIFILYNNHTYQIEKYRADDGRAPSKNYLAKLKNVDEGAYKVLKTIRNLKPRKIDNIFYVNYLASLKKI